MTTTSATALLLWETWWSPKYDDGDGVVVVSEMVGVSLEMEMTMVMEMVMVMDMVMAMVMDCTLYCHGYI